jgi:SRSO17 transposase
MRRTATHDDEKRSAPVVEAFADWERQFDQWLTPFLDALRYPQQRAWAPVYLKGLVLTEDRKSIQPLAARMAPADYQQLHHFVCTSPWAVEPLERVLAQEAQRLVGGPGAVLIIDDTGLPKQGTHSVGVARQYCGVLGKIANCQTLVSLTLAQGEVPVPLALRLFLPAPWTDDPARCDRAGVPADVLVDVLAEGPRTKWQLALTELDRVREAGVTFDTVLADAGYGMCAAFRQGLTSRHLQWAVGVSSTQHVYPIDVTLRRPRPKSTGRPRKHPVPSVPSVTAAARIAALGPRAFRRVTFRTGTKGPLHVEIARVRVCVAEGAVFAGRRRLPGAAAWLVCERRSTGEVKYYLTNHPASTPTAQVVRAIKARWSCEQGHQQLKEELGLDHFEGRSWLGLHHHALLTMISFAFLQHLRLQAAASTAPTPSEKKTASGSRPARSPAAARVAHHSSSPPRRRAARDPLLPRVSRGVPQHAAAVNVAK